MGKIGIYWVGMLVVYLLITGRLLVWLQLVRPGTTGTGKSQTQREKGGRP